MKKINLDFTNAVSFINDDYHKHQNQINELHRLLHLKKGKGNDFLGWLDLPIEINNDEIDKIIKASHKIRNESEVLVVIGIGGSYLGAKAALSFLSQDFKKDNFEILFAGHHLSTDYHYELIKYLESKDFSINIISKSGTTTEPAIAFRLLKELLINKYGEEEAYKRIYATTDIKKGATFSEAMKNGYERFVIPDDVGGRYSVLTAVGLLPLAAKGINIKQLLLGAKDAYNHLLETNLDQNDAYKYALIRNLLYQNNKKIEMMVNYNPKLNDFSEWWKQLFGESEGKELKGIFVSSASFTTDLHSLGQYIQEGERHLFETILYIRNSKNNIILKENKDDTDELNYLSGKTLDEVNYQAMIGTKKAHVGGSVPNILVEIDEISEYNLGYLFYFFEKACAMSAYILDVNPFNQPGVEEYKKNMFKLLGKKGY